MSEGPSSLIAVAGKVCRLHYRGMCRGLGRVQMSSPHPVPPFIPQAGTHPPAAPPPAEWRGEGDAARWVGPRGGAPVAVGRPDGGGRAAAMTEASGAETEAGGAEVVQAIGGRLPGDCGGGNAPGPPPGTAGSEEEREACM